MNIFLCEALYDHCSWQIWGLWLNSQCFKKRFYSMVKIRITEFFENRSKWAIFRKFLYFIFWFSEKVSLAKVVCIMSVYIFNNHINTWCDISIQLVMWNPNCFYRFPINCVSFLVFWMHIRELIIPIRSWFVEGWNNLILGNFSDLTLGQRAFTIIAVPAILHLIYAVLMR